ncbi:MAG: NUDIX domain-containing protein [Lachnospiraceae bacterium]|nr:NUDIX domain-containing protein [Lachnospiraceae bacterium]MDE7272471.1 NUDIX domain-containing protein [Lachnospiraceae bacterium]
MMIKDSRGNELVEILAIDENAVIGQYAPVTHCLAVVIVGSDYLLGWNRWRKDWETFGGCMEEGETMRACVVRECLEEIGLSDLPLEYIGLMHLNMVPDYFSNEFRVEYGGLYGVRLQPEDLQKIETYRSDREEIERVALLKDIPAKERIAEIDRELLNYYQV